MWIDLCFGSVLILATLALHAVGLLAVIAGLERHALRTTHWPPFLRRVNLLLPPAIALLMLHTVEVWMWALVYRAVGELSSLEESLYFSTVTMTTLGYGDVTLSERWRLLSSFEAMGGLLVFAMSTSFLIALFRRVFLASDQVER